MNSNKLYTLFNFISLVSEITDAAPLYQSPDYILEKFKQYLGDVDNFEFPNTFHDEDEREFIRNYMEFWGDVRNVEMGVNSLKRFENLLVFIFRANWDSGTLPSVKIIKFKKYIGNSSSIKEHECHDTGIHPVLNKWLDDLSNSKILEDDMTKLEREFTIDEILK